MSKGTGIGIALGAAALLFIAVVSLVRQEGDSASPPASLASSPSTAAAVVAQPVKVQPSLATSPNEQRLALPASFQLAGDFHAFAIEALKSDDGGVVFEGFQALRECEGMQQFADNLRIVADGGSARGMVHGDVTEERRKAIRNVLRRCEGFSKIDYRERRAMYTAFQKRGQELGAVEFSVAARPWGQFTRADLIGLLASTSPAARHLALLALAEKAGGARPEDPEAAKAFDTTLGLGFLLAGCDLGGHCGPDSYQSLMTCAQSGICGKSFLEDWEKDHGKAQIAKVDALRRQITDAVGSRNYSALGL